jgi:hypothetical protein
MLGFAAGIAVENSIEPGDAVHRVIT